MSNPTRETIHFLSSSNPPQTPWGPAKTKTLVADGIDYYDAEKSTGYQLSEERIAKMPHPMAFIGTLSGRGWYEADAADWTLVVFSFPELFEDLAIFAACEVILSGCPLHLKGVDVWLETPSAKPLRDRCDAFYAANKSKFRLYHLAQQPETGALYCKAATLDRTNAVIFTADSSLSLPPLFTMDELIDSRATILRTATHESIQHENPAS